jgi:hypothetical protein
LPGTVDKVQSNAAGGDTVATATLLDTFGALDESLYGGEAKSVEDLSNAVEASLSELKAVLP